MAESTTRAVLIEHGSPQFTDDQTLRRLAGAFVASYKSDATRRGYSEDLTQWFRWLRATGIDPLIDIQRVHGELYARHMEDVGYAPATRQRRIGTVRRWYEWLLDEEYHDGRNPMRKVAQPAGIPVRDRPYLSRREMRILLDTAQEHSPEAWAFVSLGYFNALRIGEICRADVGSLGKDGYHRTLAIHGKGDKPARVVLVGPCLEAVEACVGDRQVGALIPGIPGGPRLNNRQAGRLLDKLCREAGITRITPHSLRRTSIILALQDKQPIREVQISLARHANSKTTESYDTRRRSMDEHLGDVLVRAIV